MSEIKAGDERFYSEDGNSGHVEVLKVYRRDDGTAYRLRALERLEGSPIMKPIEKDQEFEVWAGDGAGAYCGWYLE
jgi:hypothetical protein